MFLFSFVVFGSGTSSPAAAWVALEQTGHCVPSWAAVEVARDVGKFRRVDFVVPILNLVWAGNYG